MASAVDYCRWVYEDGIRFHVPGCWSGVFDERTCDCTKRHDGDTSLLERVEELEARGWTTWRLVEEGGGSPVDGLALDLYLCVQDVDCRIGDLADVLARGFDVSADLFRNLEAAWRENENRCCDFDPPQWIFADSPAFADLSKLGPRHD